MCCVSSPPAGKRGWTLAKYTLISRSTHPSPSRTGVYARITALPFTVALTKKCWPTGRPRTCFSDGSAKRKTRVSCDCTVFDCSGSVTHFRGLSAFSAPALPNAASGYGRDAASTGPLGTATAGGVTGGAGAGAFGASRGPSTCSSNQPPKLPGPASVGCWNLSAGFPLSGSTTRWTLTRKYELFIIPITFHTSFSGWRCIAQSQPRQRISASLFFHISATDTSCSKKHHAQYLPYFVGFSGCVSVDSVHVLPPSIDTSTRITFRPPPLYAYPLIVYVCPLPVSGSTSSWSGDETAELMLRSLMM